MPPLPQTVQLRALRKRIGNNIRTHRIKKRMSLEKLSRRTGLSAVHLDHFEMGKYEIALQHMLPIACALDVEICGLLKDINRR